MKRRTLHQTLSLLLCLCLLLGISACGKKQESVSQNVCQSWYEEGYEIPSFILYTDGTCEQKSDYGTGSWSVVNDDLLKLTDSYGESNTWHIGALSDTCLILVSDSGYETVYWNSAEQSLAAAEETRQKEEEAARLEAAKKPPEVRSMSNYSEDIAWIRYNDKGEQYHAMIDKDGNALARFNTKDVSFVTDFQDGYAHVDTSNASFIIDKSGKIIRQYSSTNEETVKEDNGGYVVTEQETSGFDSVGYVYTIYGPDGTVLEQFTNEKELDYDQITYGGKGVLKFDNIGYFCAQSNTWVDGAYSLPVFHDDISVIATTYRDVNGDLFGGIATLSTTGETNVIYSDYSSHWFTPSVIVDNTCVLYDYAGYDAQLIAMDLSTMEEYPLAEEYYTKLWDDLDEEIYNPFDGRIVVHMEGADGNGYVGVFDTKMNLLFGPIEGYAKAYSSGRLVLNTADTGTVVYDTDGNIVYSITEKGYKETVERYACGALLVFDRDGNATYLDTEGNPLFEAVNFENVITPDISGI